MRKLSPGVRIGLALWFGVWALFALPWHSISLTPQWQRVEWMPFGVVRPRDIVLNVVFFVPLGALLAGGMGGRTLTAVWYAAMASLATECVQLFAIGRVPSTTDLMTNVLGALAGALCVGAASRARRGRP